MSSSILQAASTPSTAESGNRKGSSPRPKYGEEDTKRIVQQFTDFLPPKISYVLSDNYGKIIHVSDAWSRMCKYDLQDVKGLSSKFLQGPLTDDDTVHGMNSNLERGRAVKTQIINYRGNGEWFMNVCKVFPVHNENDEVAFFIGFLEDISHHLDLFSSLSEFRTLQFVSYDGLLNYPHFSIKGTNLVPNKNMEEKIFYDEEEMEDSLFNNGFFSYRYFDSNAEETEYKFETPPTRLLCTHELPWDLSLVCAWMRDLFRTWGFYVETWQSSCKDDDLFKFSPKGTIVAFRASKDEQVFLDEISVRKRQRKAKERTRSHHRHTPSSPKQNERTDNLTMKSDSLDMDNKFLTKGSDSEDSDDEEELYDCARNQGFNKRQKSLIINVFILPPTPNEGHRVAFQRLIGTPQRFFKIMERLKGAVMKMAKVRYPSSCQRKLPMLFSLRKKAEKTKKMEIENASS